MIALYLETLIRYSIDVASMTNKLVVGRSMQSFTIRLANDHDLNSITNLILRCSEMSILAEFSQEGKNAYLESHSLEKMRTRLNDFVYQVLQDENERIVGTVGVQNKSHLYHLHILPEFQRLGHGKKLWLAARKLAGDPVSGKFTVNSSRFGLPFYESLGFISKGEQQSNGVMYFPMELIV